MSSDPRHPGLMSGGPWRLPRGLLASLRALEPSDILQSDQALRRGHDFVGGLVTDLVRLLADDLDLDRDVLSILGLDLSIDLVRGRDLVSDLGFDLILASGLPSVRNLVRNRVIDRERILGQGLVGVLGSGLGFGFGLEAEWGNWAEQDLTHQQFQSLGGDPERSYLCLLLLVWARLAAVAGAIAIPGDDGVDGSPAPRKAGLEPQGASRALAAAERTLGGLDRLAASGELAEWDEEFVRNTIQQLMLWGRRDDTNPQIFELLIADLVKRFEATLTETSGLRTRLVDVGADETVATLIASKVSEALQLATKIGDDDPALDGQRLQELEERQSELEYLLGQANLVGATQESEVGGPGGVVRDELAREATRRAASAASHFVVGHWDQIRIGLTLMWHSIRQIFT